VYKCEYQGCFAGFRLKTELRDHYKVHYLDDTEEDGEYFEVITEELVE
jgi:hypothetical protein